MSKKISTLDYLKLEGIEGAWSVVQHCDVSTEAEMNGSEIQLCVSNSKGANWHSEFRYVSRIDC
ncbi:MAG TPA: hypothetical protein DEA90_00540 [Opitutae bacterium]|nr:hypothetical protein [Puniceicoccaceae bacterium]HBR92634.1 hypothetical protein [Opitutae bacterium]